MKVFQKPAHTGYLHFKLNREHQVKRGVSHILIIRSRVIYQDQKDFNKEIENTRHDLMLDEYPQEFVNCMKQTRNSCSSSDAALQDAVIIPYFKGIS
jgi:hypothetical protein